MKQCELYYPTAGSMTKHCRNCDRVIENDRPIEQYKTLMCGKAVKGPLMSFALTAAPKPKPTMWQRFKTWLKDLNKPSKKKKSCGCGGSSRPVGV